MEYKKIVQEHPMGCAVACVASLLEISYQDSLKLFNKNYVSTRGYYCRDVRKALRKVNLFYSYKQLNKTNKKYLRIPGTVVFIRRSLKYPFGHYLLKTKNGWMNPWVNYPKINSAKAGFQKNLPGKIQWIFYRA